MCTTSKQEGKKKERKKTGKKEKTDGEGVKTVQDEHVKSEKWTNTICKTFGRNRVHKRKPECINVSQVAHEHKSTREIRCPQFLKQR